MLKLTACLAVEHLAERVSALSPFMPGEGIARDGDVPVLRWGGAQVMAVREADHVEQTGALRISIEQWTLGITGNPSRAFVTLAEEVKLTASFMERVANGMIQRAQEEA